jgi:type I restriction enzyme R subunit
MQAVEERKHRKGKLGVFWHTQGAGKSYSMVFFSQKVHRRLGGNFTFLILTDRDDLDTQIYKTFAGCGIVDNDKDPCRAESGDDLEKLLKQRKTYIFTLIQKFNREVDPDDPYSLRDDIIVISDEAHRTQYGLLALNMWNALPNAGYIGFTGTPLFKDDEITRRVFGDYISTYDFKRAVDDKATVPLYYDARGDKLGVAKNDLNERIAEKLEELEIEDIDVAQRLERELKRDYHIITSQKRLNQIARDFVEHYSTAWESGKAMLVCIDKITCARMYELIEKYWAKRIQELEKGRIKAADEQELTYRRRQIKWMKEALMAVVVSEEQGEVDKFRKWELDITPHRKLIKEGFETNDGKRIDVDEAFKNEEHPFRIVIVCAMWLTGFDVPNLSTMYLDKPLKAHTLMQAIARANRVHEGKNNGLVVDYCGILKNLRKALATFAGHEGTGVINGEQPQPETDPVKPEEELLADLAEAIEMIVAFLEARKFRLDDITEKTGFHRNKAIIDAKEAVNENDETRKRFEIMAREVFKKFKACITIRGINEYRQQYDAINIIYKSLQEDRDQADIADIIRKLHEVVDNAIQTHDNTDTTTDDFTTYDISKIDFDRLRKEFERTPAKNTTTQNLKHAIEQRLHRMIQQNPLRTDFQKHFEHIVEEYNREKDRVTIENTFEELLRFVDSLDKESLRAMQEGLDEESLAIFDLLVKPDLSSRDIKQIKDVAHKLLLKLKLEKLRIDNWREKQATRDDVKVEIADFLWNERTGLPKSYSEEEIGSKADEVYLHVFQQYPNEQPAVYAGA